MRRTILWLLLTVALAATPALAGVVYEIETTDHDATPPSTGTTKWSAEGGNLKMDIAATGGRESGEMIYRGDRREMVVVDHGERSYFVLDEATMKRLMEQVSGAMSMMEEALKNVPESQRKAVEEMMKKRMPQAPAAGLVSELRRTGERQTRAGYPCVKYEIVRDGGVVRELWVTDWGNVEGGRELREALLGMARFMRQMMDNVSQGMPNVGDEIYRHMEEIDGFPVVTRGFDGGSLEDESELRSARRQTLDPAAFEPPSGYKRRSMLGQ